ncbi:hypothetical protein [Alteromonas confluentis]|uniref:Uncharacterized protein n=1 Tax=Alteromonas confluentis TaxID=1656094 RepID=A0A1E7Z7E8_9ALTE|nr:hypothetical protein [Alteromonas confluentis]OFC69361.1 hypothetical protein BFC18_18275 [Alteromonas confluentis]
MYSRSRKQRDADIDQRILHIHGFIADKLLANPALITQAELTLEARYEQKLLRYGSYLLWHSVLELRGQPEAFKKQLLSDEPRWNTLRRTTIFTGILTEEEREEALATFAASEN